MSPIKRRATGLLNGAKPSIAPLSASATTSAAGGSAPSAPMIATPAVIGTTSATIIQSMPSMKLTRLMNHTVPTSRMARSTQSGRNENRPELVGQRGEHQGGGQGLDQELHLGLKVVEVVDASEHEQQQRREQHEQVPVRSFGREISRSHRSPAGSRRAWRW